MSSAHGLDPESLDWLTLDEDETIVWSAKPHESSLIPALIVGIPLSILIVGLFIIAGTYLHRENTQYVVTTDAVYRKSGILSRDVQRIDFEKVQNTSYSQGFFGAKFGYGTVDISTAGGSGVEMQFQSVPEPREVQEEINKRVKRRRGTGADDGSETKQDVMQDILTELRGIRSALESDTEFDFGDTETESGGANPTDGEDDEPTPPTDSN